MTSNIQAKGRLPLQMARRESWREVHGEDAESLGGLHVKYIGSVSKERATDECR
jgi:hypothetical protein